MTEVGPAAFKEALIVLGAAGVVIPLFLRLRLNQFVGYLLVGMVVGPYGLGRLAALWPPFGAVVIYEPDAIAPIAELGVVVLMFMIGLELSFARLWVMRRLVFGLGGVQVAASVLVLAGVASLVGLSRPAALALGLAGAMSSTAVVLGVLSAEQRMASPLGRVSFAMLLFQDLAIVPMLLALGVGGENAGAAAVRGVVAVVLILVLGRLALRRLFRLVARTGSPELFLALSGLVVLACALETAQAGLSMGLGALLGGLLLAGTEYRRAVEVTIEPFKGLLLGVFLIGVGLGFDPLRVLQAPLATLGAAVVLVVLKLAVTAPAARLFGLPWPAAIQSGLLLGPGGEFGFVVLGVAGTAGLLPAGVVENATMALALSMAAIPGLSTLGRRLFPRLTLRPAVPSDQLPPVSEACATDDSARVFIAGFGRVGETVAALLEAHDIPYVAIDRDPDRVAQLRRAGKSVFWGDITNPALLHQLGIKGARALVITMGARREVDQVITVVRRLRPDLMIVARARDGDHAARLYRLGVTDAVPETIEASLQLSEAVLVDLGVPMGPVLVSIHERRAAEQAAIHAAAPQAQLLGRRRLRDALSHEKPSAPVPADGDASTAS